MARGSRTRGRECRLSGPAVKKGLVALPGAAGSVAINLSFSSRTYQLTRSSTGQLGQLGLTHVTLEPRVQTKHGPGPP